MSHEPRPLVSARPAQAPQARVSHTHPITAVRHRSPTHVFLPRLAYDTVLTAHGDAKPTLVRSSGRSRATTATLSPRSASSVAIVRPYTVRQRAALGE